MNVFEEFRGNYKRDFSGKCLEELSEEEWKDIVLFLDIDDTIGRCILQNYLPITEVQEEIDNIVKKSGKVISIKHFFYNVYCFQYYTKNRGKWEHIMIHFRIRKSLSKLIQWLKMKQCDNIYLYSAANSQYVECIKHILEQMYQIKIKNIISLYEEPSKYYKYILGGTENSLIYKGKDMYRAMEQFGIDTKEKVPILIDDRGYWAANGFFLEIEEETISFMENRTIEEDLNMFLKNKIFRSQGLLIEEAKKI